MKSKNNYIEVSKSTDAMKEFYPDLINKGSLAQAIQNELVIINSILEVEILNKELNNFIAYARVSHGSRSSQVYIAAQERLFIFDFWSKGVLIAKGSSTDIKDVARSINYWNTSVCSLKEFHNQFSFVAFEEKAAYFEQNKEVEYSWLKMREWLPKEFPELKPVFNLVSKNVILNKLFPYTSMNRLCLSRCTGFPYTHDIPIIEPLKRNKYRLVNSNGVVIGTGSSKEIVELLIKSLPINCVPAKQGTAEDL